MANENLISRIGETITKLGGGVTASGALEKLQTMQGMSHASGYGDMNQPEPPYQRHFSPLWIYKIRRESPLMNNAMRQKIWQTFRGGLADWEKAYEAKCPSCEYEFNGYDEFRRQMDDEGKELEEEDFDFESERTCPECENLVQMITPDPEVKEAAKSYFDRANCRYEDSAVPLEPTDDSAISQSFLDVLEEIAWDIQSFDDGWMIFERSYEIDDNGVIYGYDLENAYRGPPELMRWTIDEERGEPGGQFWVCVRCRAENDEYEPETEDCNCSECGNVTYPAYAYATKTPAGQGGQPDEFFIRGEFYKDSEYERKRWYGHPPVLTLWEEARTVEQMDSWYNDAYEERRAPRGALLVNAAHDDDLRQMNRQQMNQMREDPNYIPLFMNDSEEEGDPIKFIELLSEPAEMQHMEMREWFVDRIGAHFGVTAILMESSPGDSGLSQSMEVDVSEKQAEHFRDVLNGFVDAFLAQIGTEGWAREISEVKEDDPEREAQLVGQHLSNAQQALQMGAEVEWTDDDRADIKEGELESPEEGMEMGEGGPMGGIAGGGAMPGMAPNEEMPDQEGPEAHSLPAGEHPNDQEGVEEGDRAEGPDDPDRPAATPLKSIDPGISDELMAKASQDDTTRARVIAAEVFSNA